MCVCMCVCVCSTLGLSYFKVTEKVILFTQLLYRRRGHFKNVSHMRLGFPSGSFGFPLFYGIWYVICICFIAKKLSSRCCLKRLLIRATHNNFDLKRLIRLPIIFLQMAYLFVLLLVMLILLLINLPILAGGYLSIFCLLFLYG